MLQKNATQPLGPFSGQTLDLIIGFDFGTAFTKVVVRAPYLPGVNAFAVEFAQDAENGSPHLLPSAISVDPAGVASLAPLPGFHRYESLKKEIVFEGANFSKETAVRVVAFLALALRQVRLWTLDALSRLINRRRIRWQLNLGLPAASHDNVALVSTYTDLAHAAWALSVEEAEVTLERARMQHARVDGRDLDLEAVEIIPEVAAEAAGYARSRNRADGLHLLIDVGAGTLDVCTFILHKLEGDRYSILTADVQPLGVEALRDGGRRFQQRCEEMVVRVLIDTKSHRYPYAPEWRQGLRYFLCGGGSLVGSYGRIVPGVTDRIKWAGIHEPRRMSLFRPDDLKAKTSGVDYHRLAVAWGLSFEAMTLGEIASPSSIEDFVPVSRGRSHHGDQYEK